MLQGVTPVSVNVVCLMGAFNKGSVQLSVLRNLAGGEEPITILLPDPGAPWLVLFQKSGLEIQVVENRLQIQAKANSSFGIHFDSTIGEVLDAFGNQSINAFGFNFVADIRSASVRDVFGLQDKLQKNENYKPLPGSSVRLVYETKVEDEVVRCEFSISDGEPFNRVHVNVHFQKQITTAEFGRIATLFKKSDDLSLNLIQELVL